MGAIYIYIQEQLQLHESHPAADEAAHIVWYVTLYHILFDTLVCKGVMYGIECKVMSSTVLS